MKTILVFLAISSFLKCSNGKSNTETLNDGIKISLVNVFDYDNDTLSKNSYPNGRIKDCVFKKDSSICKEMYFSFYENVNLSAMGCQGFVENKDVSIGMSVGTWFYYDLERKLDSTIYYGNEIFGKDYIEKKIYYKSDALKEVQLFNNYMFHENEIDSIGKWKYYDSEENLLKITDHVRRLKPGSS